MLCPKLLKKSIIFTSQLHSAWDISIAKQFSEKNITKHNVNILNSTEISFLYTYNSNIIMPISCAIYYTASQRLLHKAGVGHCQPLSFPLSSFRDRLALLCTLHLSRWIDPPLAAAVIARVSDNWQAVEIISYYFISSLLCSDFISSLMGLSYNDRN